MDGLGRAVGDGITTLVSTAFDTIGGVLRALVDGANATVPFGLLPVVVFFALLGTAWVLARR